MSSCAVRVCEFSRLVRMLLLVVLVVPPECMCLKHLFETKKEATHLIGLGAPVAPAVQAVYEAPLAGLLLLCVRCRLSPCIPSQWRYQALFFRLLSLPRHLHLRPIRDKPRLHVFHEQPNGAAYYALLMDNLK